MTLDQLIDGINRGGFTFIGILFVSGCIAGLIWVARVGFPETIKRIDRILDQIDTRFAATQANSDARAKEIVGAIQASHNALASKLDELGRAA